MPGHDPELPQLRRYDGEDPYAQTAEEGGEGEGVREGPIVLEYAKPRSRSLFKKALRVCWYIIVAYYILLLLGLMALGFIYAFDLVFGGAIDR